ncbi:TonB-dependent siderophore receptor [Pararhizobium mangrovi]|uniref:TonB-dependent siderophore receptor n=1 Tax=Pararhizobium mangrovi TaxID=2590452 RepID=UPI0015E8684F|nr:TonB-dependent siderophore receptor [Pararhizobium mangrovi]
MNRTKQSPNVPLKAVLLATCTLSWAMGWTMAAHAQEASSDATTLERLSVEAGTGALEDATGPVGGIVAERSATGTKTDTAIVDTPQSIAVVSAEQMQEQAVQSNSEALRYVPGISSESFGADPRADWIRSRGFQVPEYLDGLRLPRGVFAWQQIDPWLLERIEVLKGPSSGLYGQTPPGGLVNMVSKRPTDEPLHEVQIQTGSPERYQGAFDFGGPLDPAGVFSYRLAGLARSAETNVDYVQDDRLEIAPALKWSPDEATSLTVLGHYVTKDSESLQFLPALGTLYDNPNGNISRDFFVGEPGFDDFDFEQYGIGYLFEHTFDSGVTVRQNLRYGTIDYDLDVVRTHPVFGLRADGRSLARIAAGIHDETSALTVDTNATGDFDTGPVRHTWLAGIDFIDQDTDYSYTSGDVADLDIYDPQYGASVGPLATLVDQDQSLDQLGLYLQDQMVFDRWHLTLAGRHDWSESVTDDRLSGSNAAVDDSQFTGRAGLLYAFDSGVSPYVSYSTSFEPQTGSDADGDAYVPTEGEQVEVGIKYQPPGTRSLFTLAAYDLGQDNVLVSNVITNVREQVGEVRVRGIEAEAKIDMSNGFEIIASYAYQDSEIVEATDGTQGNRVPYVPEHQASAWVNYSFETGPLAGLGLGGGVRAAGASYGDTGNSIEADGYTLFDAAVRYDFGARQEKLEGLKLAVNASNLFDKEYVASCNSTNACYYGNGRAVRGTLSYEW